MTLRTLLLGASGLAGLAAFPAAAATAAVQSGPATILEDVVVTADPLGRSGGEVISTVTVLSGNELIRRRQATLGETLNGLPGVSSDTFGAGASRPVIRGQTSPRVKVMSDSAGLIDASEVSPDHAVSGEPLLLEGVEILRGPSALIYGGGAIGGAVNLLDRKVPNRLPENGYEGAVEVRAGTADDERSAVAGLTVGAGPVAFRLEAVTRSSDDYRIPRYEAPGHDDHDSHDHDHDHAEGVTRLDGTFNDTRTLTAGVSWIGARGYLGAAYTEQRSEYGLPGHSHEYEDCHPHGSAIHCGGHDHGHDDHDHDHDHDHEGAPWVDLVSRRIDLRGEISRPLPGIERLRLRAGHTDYAHDEVDDGEVTTTFVNTGHDLRIEAQHAAIGGLRGVIGLQSSRSDFEATGLESYLPASVTRSHAVFVMEEYALGDWRFEGAVRQEWQETEAVGRPDRSHRPFSASVAANWTFAPGFVVSASAARSQRAPSVQELYARGVHLATNTFELGTATLEEETSRSLELTVRKTDGPLTFTASAYRYAYDGYIYADTLDQHEDFRLIRYGAADAVFRGVEAQARYAVSPSLALMVFGDRVWAELDSGEALPRTPPGRLGARADLYRGAWSGDLEYVRVQAQDRVAGYETRTPGYHMVNATMAYDFDMAGLRNQVFVRATNLLDEVALNHASFIADLAPLRGRNFTVGLRTRF